LDNLTNQNNCVEGYIFTSYGKKKYLKHAFVSASTIRRYDKKRPVALVCSKEHFDYINKNNLNAFFDRIEILSEEHESIVGFKHNLDQYMLFDRNMYLDSDMIMCRRPQNLWHRLLPYGFTITGQESADVFHGGHKSLNIFWDILFRRRQKTLKKFDISHLYRVQTGIMYASDLNLTQNILSKARYYFQNKKRTHFVSRINESGRKLESCEWSLSMAMSKLELYVTPWFDGYESPQLDFIEGLTTYDEYFTNVQCKYYCNPFIHGLRGLKSDFLRNVLLTLFSVLPRSMDHIWVSPYILHFGWKHQKKYYDEFARKQWEMIIKSEDLAFKNNDK
jgi:hypothetical protein